MLFIKNNLRGVLIIKKKFKARCVAGEIANSGTVLNRATVC